MRSRTSSRPVSKALRFALAVGVLVATVPVVAQAQAARLYATYGPQDTGPRGAIGIVPNVPTPVHLWIQGGTTPSTGAPCTLEATGGEICGYSFALETNADFTFTSPAPDTHFDTSQSDLAFPTSIKPGRYAANGFDLGIPPTGNRHLGTITVIAGPDLGPEDQITVSGDAIASNLEILPIVQEAIMAPEPGFGITLAASTAVLAGLGRRRRGRSAG